jgi:hypothetical protein
MDSDRHAKPTECFEFTWRRRVKGPGFNWKQDKTGRWLLVGPPDEKLFAYEPLVEETGLFLTFAHLDGSKDAFLGFANTYGRLGTYHTYFPGHREPLYEWEEHHRWMRFLAKLQSDCVSDRPKISEVVSWEGDEVIYSFPKIVIGANEPWRHRGELRLCLQSKKGLPLFQPGDLVGPARWFLCHAIENWLRTLEGTQKAIAPRMVWSEAECRPQFVFSPSSLLGAMVCQFAAALHGAWPFKECAFCHKFFRLAPGVNRANRLTCSHTCKQYLHNRKIERARQLRADGRTIRQIVKQLKVMPNRKKSSLDIVKNWIHKE